MSNHNFQVLGFEAEITVVISITQRMVSSLSIRNQSRSL